MHVEALDQSWEARLEETVHFVFRDELCEQEEGVFLCHIEQEHSHDESHSLAVSHLLVVHGVGFEGVEKRSLAHSALLLEEDVTGKGSVNVNMNLVLKL